MLGTNFGTGSIEETASLVEYCNAPTGSYYADLRAAHGYPKPHDVKYWCLGNEMDGPWQIGHLQAEAYALKAREAAKMMKWHDPSIELTLCGSSGVGMPTFPDWDRIGLESCWEQVDYLSLHCYVGNHENDTASYLGVAADLEKQVDILEAVLRYVKAKLRSRHDVFLSWDEWNVWYKDQTMQGGWLEAPHLIEEIYNLEDALVVAQWMNVFLRRCHVLKMACLAQIVNVIAPILTTTDRLVKQTIFYPFKLFRQFARGTALDVLVHSPMYATQKYGDILLLDASASYDAASGDCAVFLVNRSQTDFLPVEVVWQTSAPRQIAAVYQLSGTDPQAANTFEQPDAVLPVTKPGMPVVDKTVRIDLPPLSFTVLAGQGV
jgi:alpha-N-arabinofuranosidase